MPNEGVPLHGDRSAWNTTDHADEHASDIDDEALLRHLPAPSDDGRYARDDGTNWASQLGLLLADLADYVRGYIIRGGASDWEAYDASGDKQVLIGDGTDVISRALERADIPEIQNSDLPDPYAFKTAASTLTISAGEVTATQNLHVIAAESGTEDDLDTINDLTDRQLLLIQADTGDTITVKHGTGNIHFDAETDFELSGDSWLLLFYDGTNAVALGAGGAGGESDFISLTDTPSDYTDQTGKIATVNDAEDALEFTDGIDVSGLAVTDNPTWHVDGALAAATDVGESWRMPGAGTIVEVILIVEDQGTADSTTIDIHKNGTTIFSTQANRPSVAFDDGDNYDTGTPDVTSFDQYDEFTMDVDAVATDAEDLRVIMVIAAGVNIEEDDASIATAKTINFEGGGSVVTDEGSGKVTVSVGSGSGTDDDAIHDNVASEIHAITEKSSPVDADELIIEDSEDSYNKKRVQLSNLPGGVAEGSSGASVVHTATDTGASPHSLSTTGIAEGDVVIAAMTTRNSDPGAISGGSAWSQLWWADVGTNEETRVYWKVAGDSEPASYEWTHSSGSTVISALVIFRNLDGTLIHYGRNSSRSNPVILGSANGLHIIIMQCFYQVSSLTLNDLMGIYDVHLNYDNNDQGCIIASRDAQVAAAQLTFSFSGGNSNYVSAGAVTIE